MSGFLSLARKHDLPVADVDKIWANAQSSARRKGLKLGTTGHSDETMRIFRRELKTAAIVAKEEREKAENPTTAKTPVPLEITVKEPKSKPQNIEDVDWKKA